MQDSSVLLMQIGENMSKNSKIRAYIYLRYSSHNQDYGYSIAGQRAALEKYAQANNIEIIAEFVDA